MPGWPECNAEASSRDEALAQIRQKLAETVSHSEIVRVDLPLRDNGTQVHTEGDEWSDYGVFRNDPTWERLFAEIEENRNRRTTGE